MGGVQRPGHCLLVREHKEGPAFDRIYGNGNNVSGSGAKGVLHDSVQRHAAWTRGDFDHLT